MTQFTASEVHAHVDECNSRGAGLAPKTHAMLRAFADLLEAWEKAVPVGCLTVQRFRGSDAMVNHDFDYYGSLPDGSYSLYTQSQSAPPDSERLAEALRGILEIGKRNMENQKYDGFFNAAREALTAHATQAQPPAASVPDWTDAQCVAFMAVGLRHTEYKKGKSPTVEEIRQGAKAALAAQENPNG